MLQAKIGASLNSTQMGGFRGSQQDQVSNCDWDRPLADMNSFPAIGVLSVSNYL